MNTGSRMIICNVWSPEAREASAEARRGGGATPYDEEYSHGERGKGEAQTYAKGIADKLKGAGLHEKFKSATHEKRVATMKSAGAYEKAPDRVAEHFDSQDKFHNFIAKAVHHELSK